MDAPWREWIPGVLNKEQVRELIKSGYILGETALSKSVGLSSMDLSLSETAFKMLRGSVKPSAASYQWLIEQDGLSERLEPDKDGVFNLLAKTTYVFKLNERLTQGLADAGFYGQATAKSSVGRVDVLARLIVDGMDSYESFTPAGLKKVGGEMYLEITPITFNVQVRKGIRLTQLRLFFGDPTHSEITGEELFQTIFREPGHKEGSLSLNLSNEIIGGERAAAFCGIPHRPEEHAVPLWKEGKEKPDPSKHWTRVASDGTKRLTIEPEKFYILRSKERLAVPKGIAIYCRASDEAIGEMRIHYAGFVHPLFGLRREDAEVGTPLIFEVRGHQVPITLADGERMANLTFYRMSQDCDENDPEDVSPYEKQTLKLSDFFGQWQ